MTGYCFRTSAAASRPSSTSCCGVNRFLGSLIAVCAVRPLAHTDKASAIAAARVDAVLVAMTDLLRECLLTGTFSRSKMCSLEWESRWYAGARESRRKESSGRRIGRESTHPLRYSGEPRRVKQRVRAADARGHFTVNRSREKPQREVVKARAKAYLVLRGPCDTRSSSRCSAICRYQYSHKPRVHLLSRVK